jgi:hypothetical protein
MKELLKNGKGDLKKASMLRSQKSSKGYKVKKIVEKYAELHKSKDNFLRQNFSFRQTLKVLSCPDIHSDDETGELASSEVPRRL